MADIRDQIDVVITQYIETGLWSSSCNGTSEDHYRCRGEDCDSNLDDLGYAPIDLTAESHDAIRAEVTAFIDSCLEERPNCFDGMDAGQVGHDFYLTRNGHGVGFWDRGLGELGDWLTSVCKPYGEALLYVGDDGNVHYQG